MRFSSSKYLFLLLIFAFVAAASLAESTAVYVESNRADHNSILAAIQVGFTPKTAPATYSGVYKRKLWALSCYLTIF